MTDTTVIVSLISGCAYAITIISFFIKQGIAKGKSQQKAIDTDVALGKMETKVDNLHSCLKNYMIQNAKDITELKTLIKTNGNRSD